MKIACVFVLAIFMLGGCGGGETKDIGSKFNPDREVTPVKKVVRRGYRYAR